jgi:hypothetical protein
VRCFEDAAAQKKQQAATKTSNVTDHPIRIVLKLNNFAGNNARSTVVNNLKQTRSGSKHVQERIGIDRCPQLHAQMRCHQAYSMG